MKELNFYKVRVEGIVIPSSFIMNNACYESYHDAVRYIRDGWNEYSKDFLSKCDRKIIYEYTRENINGYLHQLTIIEGAGFAMNLTLAVDKRTLILR